jgi:hypothetical protein
MEPEIWRNKTTGGLIQVLSVETSLTGNTTAAVRPMPDDGRRAFPIIVQYAQILSGYERVEAGR